LKGGVERAEKKKNGVTPGRKEQTKRKIRPQSERRECASSSSGRRKRPAFRERSDRRKAGEGKVVAFNHVGGQKARVYTREITH